MARLPDYMETATLPQPKRGVDLIPRNTKAVAHIIENAVTTTQAGGYQAKLVFEIITGPFENRKIYMFVAVKNPNSAQAEEIGRAFLGGLAKTLGLPGFQDLDDFMNKAMEITIGIQKDNRDQSERNVVWGTAPLPARTRPAATAAVTPPSQRPGPELPTVKSRLQAQAPTIRDISESGDAAGVMDEIPF